jgi:hypothetical protein
LGTSLAGGDWANYVPGPYAFKTPEYPMFFYVRALEITAKFAARLGQASDATYYSGMATAARALYKSTFFNATTGCYAGCTYVSQVLALTLGLAGPQGSPEEVAVWARAMDWWAANATQGVPEHFGGGIISLKLAYPLLDAHGETGLALRMHLQTDRAPGFGYWIETGGATTLWEAYDMTATEGGDSRNHISACGSPQPPGCRFALASSPPPPYGAHTAPTHTRAHPQCLAAWATGTFPRWRAWTARPGAAPGRTW